MPRKAAVGDVVGAGVDAEVAEGFVADDVLSIGSAAVEVDEDAVALGKGAVAARASQSTTFVVCQKPTIFTNGC